MQFVIPAVILGGAYVTGKFIGMLGEISKAESVKEALSNIPASMAEGTKASLEVMNDYWHW